MSPPENRTAPRRGAIALFALSWVGYVGFYLCRRNFSVIMPLMGSEHHLSDLDFANAIFAFSAAYMIGQISMGALADRFGSRKVVAVGMLGSAAATWGIGSNSRIGGLLALQAMNGLAQATGWPGLGKLIGCYFPREGRGITMAWWSTNYVVGGFLGSVFAGYAVSSRWFPSLGWRRGAFFPALLLAVLAIVFYALARDRRPSREAPMSAAARTGGRSGTAMVRVLACAYFCVKLIRYSLFFWLPLYLVRATHASEKQAGYVSSLFELAGVAGVLVTGYLSEKRFESRRFPPAAAMLGCLGAVCVAAGALTSRGIIAASFGVALLGFFTYGPDALLVGAAAQDAGPLSRMGLTIGTVDGFGSLGQMASPYVVSTMTGVFGWTGLFTALGVVACFSAVILRFGFRAEILQAASQSAEPQEGHMTFGSPHA